MPVNPFQAKLSEDGRWLYIRFPYDKRMVDKINKIDNRRWVENKHCWMVKTSLDAIQFVVDHGFDIRPQDVSKLSITTHQLIEEEKNRAERAQWAQAITAPPIQCVADKMTLPAWDYQWVPLHYALLSNGTFLLGDDMAAGKSVESLMIVNHDRWAHKPVLIITPQAQTYNREIFKFFGTHGLVLAAPLHGLLPRVRYYICSYERLKYLFEDERNRIPRDFVKQFFVIVDESHLLKNAATKRNKFAKAILKQTEHRILMTGTAIMNRPDELYEQLALLNPDFMSWHQFMRRFCGMHHKDGNARHTGATNMQALHRYVFENVFVRREKEQIQDQLPEKMRDSIELKDDPLDVEANSVFEMFAKSAEVKAQDPDFLAWLENAITLSGKLGIFAHHQCMIQAIIRVCQKLKVDYVVIDGASTKKDERQGLATKFANDPKIKVAILSINVAGTGLNDLQAANVCIFAELQWTPGAIVQAENRFHRPGLKNALLIMYPLVTRFEYRLSQLLLTKLGIIRRILGPEEIPDTLHDQSLMAQIASEFNLPIGKHQ